MATEYFVNSAGELGNALVAAVDDFLHHFTRYATDVVVGINPSNYDIMIESPNKIPAVYQQFGIADFILTNEKGMYEVDEKAAFALAEKFFKE